MTRNKLSICALSVLLSAGLSPIAVAADPADVSALDGAEIQALFHSPALNAVCPLTVYSEDYIDPSAPNHAALAPSPAQANPAGKSATSVIREMLRNPEFVSSDGLDTYGEKYVSAGL